MVARRKGVVLDECKVATEEASATAAPEAAITHPDKSLNDEAASKRVRLPGTVFEVDEKGIVYYPEKLLKKLLTN